MFSGLCELVETSPCRKAYDNMLSALNPDAAFPSNVFLGEWNEYLFLESDRLFDGDFAEALARLLKAEGASAACLAKLSGGVAFSKSGVICFNLTTKGSDYEDRLTAGSPGKAWLYSMGRYAGASDVGNWCIYCERNNEIAVVGVRDADILTKLRPALSLLKAEPFSVQSGRDDWIERYPFHCLPVTWRDQLVESYGRPV
jgi:hypothetical protein